MILNYFIPSDSKLEIEWLHKVTIPLFPMKIILGSINPYKKEYETTPHFKDRVLRLDKSLPEIGNSNGLDVVISHERAEYGDGKTIPIMMVGENEYNNNQFVYQGYAHPRKPIIFCNFPNNESEEIHATLILAHELMHKIRMDSSNKHCEGLLNNRANCIMHLPNKELIYKKDLLENMGHGFCDSCKRDLESII